MDERARPSSIVERREAMDERMKGFSRGPAKAGSQPQPAEHAPEPRWGAGVEALAALWQAALGGFHHAQR